ncbi:MAG: TetR/AcrR family transcriptional regulator [Galbitalea sp.]
MDVRQQKSRAALIAAAIELVDERDVADISVTDLAARAGLTRMTFYQHFSDRDALLQAAGAERFGSVLSEFGTERGQRRGLAAGAEVLLEHLGQHRIFYQRLLEGTSGILTYRSIQGFLADRIAAAAGLEGVTLDEAQKLFLGGGAMAHVSRWLDDDAVPVFATTNPAAAIAALISSHIDASR